MGDAGDAPQNKKKDYNLWSSEEKKLLVELLVEGMKRGWRDSSGVMNKATVENRILQVLNERLGCQKIHEHYVSRIKYLRTLYQSYLDLERNSSGFGWDPETKRFTASEEVWQGYIEAHPKHKFLRYESHEQFDDLKIIFNGTTANGNSSVGLGDATDARTYEIGDNQVKESLIFSESDDAVDDGSSFSEQKQKRRAEKLIPRKRSRTEAALKKPDNLESDDNDSVITVSNRILNIIKQREERQQKKAEKREEKLRKETEQKEAEKKKNNVWDAMKEITDLDQRSKFKAVTLVYSLGMKDVFVDMSVEERRGWIQTNISFD